MFVFHHKSSVIECKKKRAMFNTTASNLWRLAGSGEAQTPKFWRKLKKKKKKLFAEYKYFKPQWQIEVAEIWSFQSMMAICSLGYFLFQLVVHNWFIKGCGMCCPVWGMLHIKELLLLTGKSSLCGDSRFLLKHFRMSNRRWWNN